MSDRWMVCSACRKEIPYAASYFACSVSTCNRAATRLVFCSVPCWDSHLSVLRHRDAGAIEQTAPAHPEAGAAMVRPPSPPARPAPPPIVRPASAPMLRPASAPTARPEAPAVVHPAVQTPPAAAAPPAPREPAPEPAASALELQPADEDEVLIVVSRMKKYIRDRSGMNSSDAVAERLSAHVRLLCDAAIRTAAEDGRKTVLDRDVPSVRR